MHILMVAAENDALPGGKVGGLGDVIRDLPPALSRAGHRVSVLTPGYGVFSSLPGAREIATIPVRFCGRPETLVLFEIPLPGQPAGTRQLVLEHPLFSAQGPGRIYITDDTGPFATDAHRFALFCAGVAAAVESDRLGQVDVLHCHDWHTGMLLTLRRHAAHLPLLRRIHTVYSIHNLSLQGTRPFRGDDSSLQHWFQDLHYDPARIADPRYPDCFNPMRAGINLADRVHTVSPTYAREILVPSLWDEGKVGGEGLEEDLRRVHDAGNLHGILNGCEYDVPLPEPCDQHKLWRLMEQQLDQFAAAFTPPSSSYYFARRNLENCRRRRGAARPLLVSIGRLTTQKLFLLTRPYQQTTVMDVLLQELEKGIFVMLGSGDSWHDRFFTDIMQRHSNFIYLCGFSQSLADLLYVSGDLFVMPSIYEPCGISQMLALRAGVPCFVHGVGGLNDTVQNQVNGFSFDGDTLAEKLDDLLYTLRKALRVYRDKPGTWYRLQKGARASRFSWDTAVATYLERLYRTDANAIR